MHLLVHPRFGAERVTGSLAVRQGGSPLPIVLAICR